MLAAKRDGQGTKIFNIPEYALVFCGMALVMPSSTRRKKRPLAHAVLVTRRRRCHRRCHLLRRLPCWSDDGRDDNRQKFPFPVSVPTSSTACTPTAPEACSVGQNAPSLDDRTHFPEFAVQSPGMVRGSEFPPRVAVNKAPKPSLLRPIRPCLRCAWCLHPTFCRERGVYGNSV